MKEEEFEKNGIHYLPSDDYAKAVGQFRTQLNGVFNVFDQYGQNVYIPNAIEEVVRLAEDFGLRVRGVDKPIALDIIRKNGVRRRKKA
jgi:hypothetical protein